MKDCIAALQAEVAELQTALRTLDLQLQSQFKPSGADRAGQSHK